jgi:hypothetical protein
MTLSRIDFTFSIKQPLNDFMKAPLVLLLDVYANAMPSVLAAMITLQSFGEGRRWKCVIATAAQDYRTQS